jgi:hypothetical protein
MRFLRSKKFLVLLAGLVAAGITAAIAIPAVISQSVIADGTSVHFRVVKTNADGFDSGWRVTPGLAFIQIQQGSFQFYQGSCTPRTLGAGETFIEVPYEPFRGVATGAVVFTTTFVTNGPDPFVIPLSSYSPGLNPCPALPFVG